MPNKLNDYDQINAETFTKNLLEGEIFVHFFHIDNVFFKLSAKFSVFFCVPDIIVNDRLPITHIMHHGDHKSMATSDWLLAFITPSNIFISGDIQIRYLWESRAILILKPEIEHQRLSILKNKKYTKWLLKKNSLVKSNTINFQHKERKQLLQTKKT